MAEQQPEPSPPGWRQIGQRYWHSIAFRLTLTHGVLAVLSTTILLSFIYLQVSGVLREELSRQINALEEELVLHYHADGLQALAASIERAATSQRRDDGNLYLLLDDQGRRLAGNMLAPPPYPSYSGPLETRVEVDGREVLAVLKLRHLPDGALLLAGHSASRLDQVTELIFQGVAATVALALLLVLLGTYVFRHELELRVGEVRDTARRIGAGELSLRVPPTPRADEFAHLGHDVNEMLDRIERLMTGVRDVSDSLAHDLRTPLMRMQARLRSVQRPEATRAELAETVERLSAELEQLTALLGKLLQISEMEAGVRRQAFEPCRLDRIAADVVELYDALAEERSVAIELPAPPAVHIEGDAQLLANACANLLDNALKYAAQRVRVDLSLDPTSQTAHLRIQDDGPGLPPERLQRLGERFYRPDLRHEGLGLGLASVKAIVSLHGGQLRFGQAALGGFEAALRLPLRQAAAPAPADESAHHPG